jgi:small-conductance mechanosensitive channel
MAGISLIISRAYKVGDRVRIGDHLGDVVEMALPYTRLRTIKKEDVIISNSVVTQKEIINYSAPAEEAGSTILSTSLSIGYDVPGDLVTGLCMKAVDVTDGFLKDPPPVVFQKSLDDSYITYVVFAHHRSPHEMVTLNSKLNAALREVFDTAGVEIMSPTYLAHRNGNRTTINERYRQGPEGLE